MATDWSVEMLMHEFSRVERTLRVAEGFVAMHLEKGEGRRRVEEIKQAIIREFADQDPPAPDVLAQAGALFVQRLLASGFRVSSAGLVKIGWPRHVGGLNEEEAVCLWLDMFGERSLSPPEAGLWQLFVDIARKGVGLPPVIERVFGPPPTIADESAPGDFIDQVDEEMRVARVTVSGDEPGEDMGKILAWVVATRPLARTTGWLDAWNQASSGVGEGYPQLAPQPPDTPVAQAPVIVAAVLNGRVPDGPKPVTSARQALLRGRNTLLDKFVRRVYDVICTTA